ncbi:hypothetical protein P8452_11909 [Trifolium repens]|nr:hypothetical protein P8452_11909 [Trifolium repens]
MGNNEDDEPNPGVGLPILNVDLDQYSYFDLVDDINRLATDVGYKDADVLEMFKLNNMCSLESRDRAASQDNSGYSQVAHENAH